MTSDQILQQNQRFILKTYAADRILVRGRGAAVWDADGRRFLDFTSGIAVCNLGHCHPAVTRAIQDQAQTLVHVSNLFLNEHQPALAATIVEHAFDGRVFFANSGAEANEGMIKFARRWGADRNRDTIVCMTRSFHGRTLATLAATDKPKFREGFGPDVSGFRFVPFNDLAALEAAVDQRTAAIFMEPIQGEGGVIPATADFIAGARRLCDDRGALLLFDEVQSGVGRTGHWFAFQHYGIEPDAMSMAKALGNGYPVGAFLVRRRWEDVFLPGTHASTFGGTPLACAAARAVFATIENDDLLSHCRAQSDRLRRGLTALAANHSAVTEVRGLGLLLGVVCDRPVKPAVQAAAAAGLLTLTAGENVLRLLPPLTITAQEIDQALPIIDSALGELRP